MAHPTSDAPSFPFNTQAQSQHQHQHQHQQQQQQQQQQQSQSVDGRYSASPEPDINGINGAGQRHHRAYQACEACRERKVKCDMGPVDQPHEPPCAKCKREHKQCVFSSSRKKSPNRKTSLPSNGVGLKRVRTGSSIDETVQRPRPPAPPFHSPGFQKSAFSTAPNSYTSSPVSTVARQVDMGHSRNVRSIPPIHPAPNGHILPPLSQATAALRPSGGDAQFHSRVVANLLSTPIASSQDGMQLLFQAAAETSAQSPSAMQSPHSDSRRSRTFSANIPGGGQPEVIIPIRGPEHAAEVERALEVWSRMRFVRAGWFSAVEAMNYIEYFYTRLAPMTPVVTPDYRSPSRHAILLTEEPVLTLTILAITSRQMPLSGIGANSRSYNVHDKLWDALRRMVERLLWGQEQFGGGLYGAGAAPIRETKTGQITWKGSLRTLGTIEALLLLTDWQPRALHFPPAGDDENWLIDGRTTQVLGDSAVSEEDSASGVALPSSLEPGWRSDRMSWMLLGLAQSLAFELGVFDNDLDPRDMQGAQLADFIRKRRLRRLMLLFVAQTSGRIGMKSMLSPEKDRDTSQYSEYREDSMDRMQKLWLEIASIMYNANLDIFPSRQKTKDLLDSNKYKDEIDKLTPRLQRWKAQFDRVSDEFSATTQSVLLMEYEYARLFINSPSFNKVVETWRGQGPNVDNNALTQIAEDNKKYINEVKEAATNLVSTCLSGFAEPKQLKDAPIRTYLRSFAGVVFTLKLFSLGNHEASLRRYFTLLDHISEALEVQVVDDIHISSQIALTVKTLLVNVRASLVRVQKSNTGSGPPSREHSRAQSPHRTLQRGQSRNNLPLDARYMNMASELSPDPLADIQAKPITEYAANTFFPPPEMNHNDIDMSGNMAYDSSFDQKPGDADWFALPLDLLFTSANEHLETGFPGVNNIELIDVLTGAQHSTFNQWNNGVYLPGQGMGMNGY